MDPETLNPIFIKNIAKKSLLVELKNKTKGPTKDNFMPN